MKKRMFSLRTFLHLLAVFAAGVQFSACESFEFDPKSENTFRNYPWIVNVRSVYYDEELKHRSQISGTGSIVQIFRNYYVLTASHVSQGEDLVIELNDGRRLNPIKNHRLANNDFDMELIRIEDPKGVRPRFSWDYSLHMFSDQGNGASVASGRGHLIRDGSFFPLLQVSREGFVPVTEWMSCIPQHWTEENSSHLFWLRRNITGEHFTAYARVAPGLSGSPLLARISTGTTYGTEVSDDVSATVFLGVTQQYSRFFKRSRFSTSYQIGRLVKAMVAKERKNYRGFIGEKPKMSATEWRMRNRLTYRDYGDESQEAYFSNAGGVVSYSPTGRGKYGDGGTLLQEDAGRGKYGDGGSVLQEDAGRGKYGDGGFLLSAGERGLFYNVGVLGFPESGDSLSLDLGRGSYGDGGEGAVSEGGRGAYGDGGRGTYGDGSEEFFPIGAMNGAFLFRNVELEVTFMDSDTFMSRLPTLNMAQEFRSPIEELKLVIESFPKGDSDEVFATTSQTLRRVQPGNTELSVLQDDSRRLALMPIYPDGRISTPREPGAYVDFCSVETLLGHVNPWEQYGLKAGMKWHGRDAIAVELLTPPTGNRLMRQRLIFSANHTAYRFIKEKGISPKDYVIYSESDVNFTDFFLSRLDSRGRAKDEFEIQGECRFDFTGVDGRPVEFGVFESSDRDAKLLFTFDIYPNGGLEPDKPYYPMVGLRGEDGNNYLVDISGLFFMDLAEIPLPRDINGIAYHSGLEKIETIRKQYGGANIRYRVAEHDSGPEKVLRCSRTVVKNF